MGKHSSIAGKREGRIVKKKNKGLERESLIIKEK